MISLRTVLDRPSKTAIARSRNQNGVMILSFQKIGRMRRQKCPSAVHGDFNPVSTGLKASVVRQCSSLTQIVNVKTRDTGILDWTFTNRPKVFALPIQLPKIGRNDHYAVYIKPCNPAVASRANRSIVYKRDLRDSCVCAFGRWITGFNWTCEYRLAFTKDKFELFYSILQDAVERYLPYRKFRICSTDKPWITSSVKTLIARRQRAFIAQGKDTHAFRLLRNKVQREIGKWKSKHFNSKVSSLRDTNVSRW